MLLSGYRGDTGESYPKIACGRSDEPAWILYAEPSGGNTAVDINAGQYIFLYLALPQSTFLFLRRILVSGHVRQLFEFFIIALDKILPGKSAHCH